MRIEDSGLNHTADHIMDWLEDSVSFVPSFLDDPYNLGEIDPYQWFDQTAVGFCNDPINISTSQSSSSNNNNMAVDPNIAADNCIKANNHQQKAELSKKRKANHEPIAKTSQKKNQSRRVNHEENEGKAVVEEVAKKSSGNKKGNSKAAANNGNNGNNKEGRWAEQLLNPCAAAIAAGNLQRVQHLVYVLHELALPTGDANHRLATHGLRALTHYLSPSTTTFSSTPVTPITFASTDPKLFQRSLLKFYEVSPWFAFPNNIANSSILQILSQEQDRTRTLHILDIGVSHGMQWPTLLEALTRRPGGPPPLVRITVVAVNDQEQNSETPPFSLGPPGDNFSSRLLAFAKSMNINLQINKIDNHPLQKLNTLVIDTYPEETLIVCAQFRLHNLNHNTPDERSNFLQTLKSLAPKGVILSDNNMECSCNRCGDFATGFARKVEYLWRFLDSTSSAFKGRDSEERRMMEGEAAKALTNCGEMNEGKEKWCERLNEAGFAQEEFGEDAIDGARALLRKYDNNWEMRVDEKDRCVGLWWKGQAVSFCSLWKLNVNGKES